MQAPPERTKIEKIAGSLPVEAAATMVAAIVGGPLAPLLPVLAKSLASERQRLRIESYLVEISRVLENHEESLRKLSDPQFKLINEAILAGFHTTQAEKLTLLRRAVRRSLALRDIEFQEAVILSRILRDISVEEAMFVVNNSSYRGVYIADPRDPGEDGILRVRPNSTDESLVSGLLSLGVLTPGQPTLGQILGFSRIVPKLISLLKESDV